MKPVSHNKALFHQIRSPSLLEGDGINHVHAVGKRLVHRTALCHLRESLSLSIIERSTDRHVRLNAFDPTVRPLIAVDAIVCVDSAELELHVDAVEGDPLMVSIESEGNGDAGGEPPQQQLVGRRSRVSPPAPSGSSPRQKN